MYKKLLSETVIYGIGSILPRLINFALIPLYTDKIDTEEFAMFAQLYALVAFVNIVLTCGFETAYFRYSADKNLSGKVFHTSFWFVFVNALVFLIGMHIFNVPIAKLFDYQNHPEYLNYFAWVAFFDAICMVPFAFLRFTNKPIKYSAIKVFQGVFQTLIILAFFYLVPENILQKIGLTEKVSYPFVANVIAAFSGILLLSPILKQVRFYFNWDLFKTMFRYAFPIMLAGLAFTTNENLDKLVLRGMISDEEAGAYAGCYKIATLMILMVTAYRLGIEPFFFKKAQEENAKKTYADIMLYFVIFCGFAVVALIGNLSWIKSLLIRNEEYWVAIKIVPIIVIANFFFGIYYNLSTWYKVTDKTYVGTVVSWIGAGLTIVLNLILIPIIGFMASAWATLIAYGSMMVISYFWGQKSYKIPYKSRKILFYMILSIGLGILAYNVLDNNFWVGNLCVMIYIALAIFIEKSSLKLEKK
ncbi:lipopolysaccharide biosynthesis protein [Moheibacter lacus]|uniref:Oligosaccharide flippase family protein n=1 Tax=Moheibacter lacus TaxID=2745851 RepID=A0A838ZS34_9FLAO|nr:oligosaccharide flippase family protein [Moheibacter lacus]MBA5628849.1 oligosaccharide flippase family protein [Moheibacter lacus]